MKREDLRASLLPDKPGVYRFLDARGNILYIGKATSLRDRARSYFANDLMHTRGKHIVDMVVLAKRIDHTVTDSVLDALVLEAALIKKHQPYFNTKEKDDKSWNYVVITNEEYPRVLTIRERTMSLASDSTSKEYRYVFGPFTQGAKLDVALRLVRKILPFRDRCTPGSGKPCFERQIGLCPGVCTGEVTKRIYTRRIAEIRLFFEGKKARLVRDLTKSMERAAHALEFEVAGEYKRQIFALTHIQDTALISDNIKQESRRTSAVRRKRFRVEAYDIAHISGTNTVGVMVVLYDGVPEKGAYRKFRIKEAPEQISDTAHLAEVLRRRFAHTDWVYPDLIVIDGGVAQKNMANRVLKEFGLLIPVLSVVKDERHKPRAILGSKDFALSYQRWVILANAESHRFAVTYHRSLRGRLPK